MANFLNNRFMTNNTYNTMFPWLNKSNYDKVIAYGNSLWLEDEEEKKRAENNYYRKNVNKMVNDQILDERDDEINQQSYQAATLNSEWANEELRKTEISQALKRKYNLNAKANDKDVFDDFAEWLNDEWKKLLAEYVAWKSDEFLYVSWLAERPKEEEKKEKLEETWWQKAWDFATWVAQSPWKWWYNLIWQWIDRLGKWWAEQLQGSDLQKWVQDKAIEMFGEDEVRAYQEEKAKQLEEWTAFKGRTQTDITKPILWEERANSWWTKGWEVVWDIATWIALTSPIAVATAPMYASSTLWWAITLWWLEWALDSALITYWSTWETPTYWDLALWAITWWFWWVFSRYLQNLPKTKADGFRKEAEEYINKSIKPTVKGKMNQADYNKFIDDTLDVTHFMNKNKKLLEYTDDAWEKVTGQLPKTLRETSETLSNLKKTLYDAYNDIATQAWDKWARVNLNKVFDNLDDLEKSVPQNLGNMNSKTVIWNFKRALLENTDDLWTISIADAQKTAQEYNSQLTSFFKNISNSTDDVSRNAITAKVNKWLKDAIDDSISETLDNSIKWAWTNAAYYKDLKWMYSKIKTIEDEIAKRAIVDARKNTKWLSTSVLDAFAWWDITEALLTADISKLGKWAIIKAISKYYNYLNDPNVQIGKLFKLVEETANPWSTQNIVQKWLNTIVDSIPNTIKEWWKELLKQWVKPNVLATAWEVLTND